MFSKYLPCFKRNKFQADGEVNQIEIQVVKTQILKTLPTRHLHVLGLMIGVPELGCHKQLLSLHNTSINRSSDPLSHLNFISIVTSTINMSVSSSDNLLNQLRSSILANLPTTITNCWHCSTIWKRKNFHYIWFPLLFKILYVVLYVCFCGKNWGVTEYSCSRYSFIISFTDQGSWYK